MMQFYFLPVLAEPPTPWFPSGHFSNQYAGPPTRTGTKNWGALNWMDKECEAVGAYYPHTLASYYYMRDRALNLPKEGYVVGDSGGFSIMRYGGDLGINRDGGPPHQRRLDPVDVIKWQADICDVGLLIDVPPINLEGRRVWTRALDQTEMTTKRALRTYQRLREQGHPFRWWGVVHGWTDKHLDEWWERIHAIYPFEEEGEGWATRARPTSFHPPDVARRIRWLTKKKVTRTHFLAAGGRRAVVVFCTFGEDAGLDFITCDSTAGMTEAMNRKALVPSEDQLSYSIFAENGPRRNVRDYLLACPCASCQQLRDATEGPNAFDPNSKYGLYWHHRITFHNILTVLNCFNHVEQMARANPNEALRAVLGDKVAGEVLRTYDGRHSSQVAVGMPRRLTEGLEHFVAPPPPKKAVRHVDKIKPPLHGPGLLDDL